MARDTGKRSMVEGVCEEWRGIEAETVRVVDSVGAWDGKDAWRCWFEVEESEVPSLDSDGPMIGQFRITPMPCSSFADFSVRYKKHLYVTRRRIHYSIDCCSSHFYCLCCSAKWPSPLTRQFHTRYNHLGQAVTSNSKH